MNRVEFIGRPTGDGGCFLWADVPIQHRAGLVAHHSYDLEHGERLDTIYPGTLFDTMGCVEQKKYRFTITVEEIE